MNPVLVTEEFFSAEECNHVFDTLMLYKDKWVDIKDTPLNKPTPGVDINKHFAHFFGPSVYSMTFMDKHINKYLDVKDYYNAILTKEFSHFYDRIRYTLSDTLEVDCHYDSGVALPGFHIFGPGKDISYNFFYYHIDEFPTDFNKLIEYGKIYSFIIPIRLPKTGGALLYNEDQRYEYKEGSLSYWDGMIPHRIAGFTLSSEDDWRVTWQIHVAVSALRSTGTIFW